MSRKRPAFTLDEHEPNLATRAAEEYKRWRRKKVGNNPVRDKPPVRPKEKLRALALMNYKAYLKTEHWRKTREKVIRQRKRRCEICGSKNRLQAHHLTYKRVGHERMSDLQVLCYGCHRNEHEGKVAGVYDPMTEEFMAIVGKKPGGIPRNDK